MLITHHIHSGPPILSWDVARTDLPLLGRPARDDEADAAFTKKSEATRLRYRHDGYDRDDAGDDDDAPNQPCNATRGASLARRRLEALTGRHDVNRALRRRGNSAGIGRARLCFVVPTATDVPRQAVELKAYFERSTELIMPGSRVRVPPFPPIRST